MKNLENNQTLGKRYKNNNSPMFIKHNNTLITDPNGIENTFSDYFQGRIKVALGPLAGT